MFQVLPHMNASKLSVVWMKQQLFWVPGTFIYPGKVHFAAGVWRRPLISRRSTVQGLKRKDIKLLFSSFRDSFTFLLTLNEAQNFQTSWNDDGLALTQSFFFFCTFVVSTFTQWNCLCGGHLVPVRTCWRLWRSSSVNICRYPSQPDCSLTVTDFCTEFIFCNAVTLYTLYVNKVRGNRVDLFEWVFWVNRYRKGASELGKLE